MESLKDRFIQVEVKLPSNEEKVDIIKCFLKKIKHNISGAYIENLAQKTEGWSIRDLKNLYVFACNNCIYKLNQKIKNEELTKEDITSEMQQIQEVDFEEIFNDVCVQVKEKKGWAKTFNKWCFRNKETMNNVNTLASIGSAPLNAIGSVANCACAYYGVKK